eukprot:68170-Amphidinium_carterae.1
MADEREFALHGTAKKVLNGISVTGTSEGSGVTVVSMRPLEQVVTSLVLFQINCLFVRIFLAYP